MMKFIREALREFDHVVWPTRAETKKYFTVVVTMITVCAIVLFAFSSGVTSALFAVRSATAQFRPAPAASADGSDDQTQQVLDKLKLLTGSTASGVSASKKLSGTVSGPATPNHR